MNFRLPLNLVRRLFRLLYGPLAPFYDLISATFFLGQWRHWQQSVLPHAHGSILEVGAGTGALLEEAQLRGMTWTAVELSAEMIRQIRGRPGLKAKKPFLLRAEVQHLPFRNGAFDTVVSTFPTEYIFDNLALCELGRVVNRDGSILVVPGAVLLPSGFLEAIFDRFQRLVEGELSSELRLPGPDGFQWDQIWSPSPKGRSLLLRGRRGR